MTNAFSILDSVGLNQVKAAGLLLEAVMLTVQVNSLVN